ncbi:MAG: hypothetical protein MHPDNHAH_00995 [Anaerolineales bacterium]|nr:hypothetical protein [Anaerolineales bacterium]WKZ46383.1 MAG: hypothetical protein QY306_11265 [Anaerolineales bacterium]
MKWQYLRFPLLAIILYLYLNLFANALVDDTFITLQYAKTLLHYGTWGFLPGYTTNAITSPLNTFLLSFTTSILGTNINAVILLSALIMTLIVFWSTRISNLLFQTEFFGYAASGALILNPLLISTLGLESILFSALYILTVYLYIMKRWNLLAVVLGLLTITRFDGILFFAVALFFLPSLRLRLQFTLIFLCVIAPWHIFSWVFLGSIFPDTLFIKITQGSWGEWDFYNGLGLYYRTYMLATIFSVLFLPLLLLILNKDVRKMTPIPFLVMTGLTHYLAYSALHVPPYFWYYAPEITAIVLVGSLSLGKLFLLDGRATWKSKVTQAIVTGFIILQATGIFLILNQGGFFLNEMPIHTNWATHEQFKTIGEQLRRYKNKDVILVDGEVGTIGYYCDCELSSFFSDRKWMNQYVKRQTSGEGITPFLFRINFLFWDDSTTLPSPKFLLHEAPNGHQEDQTNIMQWHTSTRWLSNTLIELKYFQP